MSKVICKRLDQNNQIVEKFEMQRETAKKIVKKGQGEWESKNIVVLFCRSNPPDPVEKECMNQRYTTPTIVKSVQYCIAEQERERVNKQVVNSNKAVTRVITEEADSARVPGGAIMLIKQDFTPLPGISISSQLRSRIRRTVLAQAT